MTRRLLTAALLAAAATASAAQGVSFPSAVYPGERPGWGCSFDRTCTDTTTATRGG